MLKTVHVASVAITLILFLVRGGWYLFRPNQPLYRPLRYLPHINDTILTITGISMAVSFGISPLVETWFLAKLIALFAYIGLGMYAFKEHRLYGKRMIAWILALCVFLYIFGVVRTHSALVLI